MLVAAGRQRVVEQATSWIVNNPAVIIAEAASRPPVAPIPESIITKPVNPDLKFENYDQPAPNTYSFGQTQAVTPEAPVAEPSVQDAYLDAIAGSAPAAENIPGGLSQTDQDALTSLETQFAGNTPVYQEPQGAVSAEGSAAAEQEHLANARASVDAALENIPFLRANGDQNV
jgi:hypothetical protein